jgi:NAD kinase
LEQATFTRSVELERRYVGHEVWHVVGAHLVEGGGRGESSIQRSWTEGERLWRQARFAVFHRAGRPPAPEDVPPRAELFEVEAEGSSADIREKLFQRRRASGTMPEEVAEYVERHGLYRLSEPTRATRITLGEPRLLIVADERNPKAQAWAQALRRWEDVIDPELIVVLGGDGMMLHAIHQHWRRRVPFFGINAGHLGFLLNELGPDPAALFPPSEVVLRELPMLYVTSTDPDGNERSDLAFNDAWLERLGGQSAWLEVSVDGRLRFEKLVCDGILASTAAGSTAYATSMGATPLLADTHAWLLVGSNVMTPRGWKSALLSMESEVLIRTLHREKRPTRGYANGTYLGEVVQIRIRPSRTATAALAWLPQHDMAEKIARMQFPAA